MRRVPAGAARSSQRPANQARPPRECHLGRRETIGPGINRRRPESEGKPRTESNAEQAQQPPWRSAEQWGYRIEGELDTKTPCLRNQHQRTELQAGFGPKIRCRIERSVRRDRQEEIQVLKEYGGVADDDEQRAPPIELRDGVDQEVTLENGESQDCDNGVSRP
jgi:hypothetical protein